MKKDVGYIIVQSIRVYIPKYYTYQTIVDECVFVSHEDAKNRILDIVNKKICKNGYVPIFKNVNFLKREGITIDKTGIGGFLIKRRHYQIKMIKLK